MNYSTSYNSVFILPTVLYALDERVTLDFGRALQKARTAKSLTQKDLATVCHTRH